MGTEHHGEYDERTGEDSQEAVGEREVGFHGRYQVFSFQRSVFSKGGEQRFAQAVGIWRKYFLCSNQAGSSPHERWMKFSENDFSWRDLF